MNRELGPRDEGIGKEVAGSIAQWGAGNPHIRRVWVYGSRANGTHRPDSDINIAVELEPVGDSEETLSIWLANGALWQSQLQSRIPLRVDLEWFDPDGGTSTLQAALDRGKVLVYERVA
jgi:uncharacterized protein